MWFEVKGFRPGFLMAVIMVHFSISFLAAWNFHFATTTDRTFWRFCAIYHDVFSLLRSLSTSGTT